VSRARNAKVRGDPASPGFRLEDSPFFLMNRTVGAYGLAMERALRAVGTDIPRWRVLMLAHERGPISVGEIAENAVLKLSTATKVVQRLRDEGLVRVQRRSEDARVTDVEASAAGEDAVSVVREAASRLYQHAFRDIAPGDIEQLNKTLVLVQRNLRIAP
jgi:MarR family transcriptional regulator, organic hydroperoxide resistance regulator